MPLQAKFTRDEIVDAALAIVRENGMQTLTARALGEALGSSARPVFTVFQSMEQVRQAVLTAARAAYDGYTKRALSQTPAFKMVGLGYLQFASDEPKLFQLLFMSEKDSALTVDEMLALDTYYDEILFSLQTLYRVPREIAHKVYRHLWLYTHGVASLIATGVCKMQAEELGALLTEAFQGIFKQVAGSGQGAQADLLRSRKGKSNAAL